MKSPAALSRKIITSPWKSRRRAEPDVAVLPDVDGGLEEVGSTSRRTQAVGAVGAHEEIGVQQLGGVGRPRR